MVTLHPIFTLAYTDDNAMSSTWSHCILIPSISTRPTVGGRFTDRRSKPNHFVFDGRARQCCDHRNQTLNSILINDIDSDINMIKIDLYGCESFFKFITAMRIMVLRGSNSSLPCTSV